MILEDANRISMGFYRDSMGMKIGFCRDSVGFNAICGDIMGL